MQVQVFFRVSQLVEARQRTRTYTRVDTVAVGGEGADRVLQISRAPQAGEEDQVSEITIDWSQIERFETQAE
jgi:hypothetical protein